MAKKKNKIISQEQSDKSQNGNSFNTEGDMAYKRLSYLDNYIYVKKEPRHSIKTIVSTEFGNYVREDCFNPDHQFAIIFEKDKSVLVVYDDATTTFRNDRGKNKGFDARTLRVFEDKIKEDFVKLYPQYRGYKIIYTCFTLFPSELSTTLKNIDEENKYVDQFCVSVNLGIHTLSTSDKSYAIDAAARLYQIVEIIKEICTNINKYQPSEKLIANIYNKKYASNYLHLIENKKVKD